MLPLTPGVARRLTPAPIARSDRLQEAPSSAQSDDRRESRTPRQTADANTGLPEPQRTAAIAAVLSEIAHSQAGHLRLLGDFSANFVPQTVGCGKVRDRGLLVPETRSGRRSTNSQNWRVARNASPPLAATRMRVTSVPKSLIATCPSGVSAIRLSMVGSRIDKLRNNSGCWIAARVATELPYDQVTT